jgi:hypothetical protein
MNAAGRWFLIGSGFVALRATLHAWVEQKTGYAASEAYAELWEVAYGCFAIAALAASRDAWVWYAARRDARRFEEKARQMGQS